MEGPPGTSVYCLLAAFPFRSPLLSVHSRYWPFYLGTFACAIPLLRTLPLYSHRSCFPTLTNIHSYFRTQFEHHVFRQVFFSCQPFTPPRISYLFYEILTMFSVKYLYIYILICMYHMYDLFSAHAFPYQMLAKCLLCIRDSYWCQGYSNGQWTKQWHLPLSMKKAENRRKNKICSPLNADEPWRPSMEWQGECLSEGCSFQHGGQEGHPEKIPWKQGLSLPCPPLSPVPS